MRRLSGLPPSRRWRWPAGLLAAAGLLVLASPLLDPSRLPVLRDVVVFHLPLRQAFARLAAEGLPLWNPLINGGQPILSNPNYAAFYPLTWILIGLPQTAALKLLLLVQLAWGGWGAWRLVRRLGCEPGPAGLAALSFAAGPLVAITDTVTIFNSWSWFPWVLLAADHLLAAEDRRTAGRAALALGLCLALQLFAGDPTSVILSAAAAACMALPRLQRSPGRALSRLAVAACLTAGIAAIQLLPTAVRVAGSARAGGLDAGAAQRWSLPPSRLVELIAPRAFGDAARFEEVYFFGRALHDRQSPYLPSIYVGLFPLVLALTGALRRRIPYRAAWLAMLVLGLALALGRHLPLAAELLGRAPPFHLVRYPEKFMLLACGALSFLGALAWNQMLLERRRGEASRADLPAALGGVAAAVLGLGLAALLVNPGWFDWLVRPHLLLEVPPDYVTQRLAYLTRETAVSLGVAVAVAGAILLHRWRRPPEVALWLLVLALLAGELIHFQGSLVRTEPIDELLAPPPVLRTIGGAEARIYSNAELVPRPAFSLQTKQGRVGANRRRVVTLAPYTGTLYGLGYAANLDFDVLATRWARHATGVVGSLWFRRETDLAYRFLGAWNVAHVLIAQSPDELVRSLRRSGEPRFVRVRRNPYLLPRYRPVRRVTYHDDLGAAVAAARRERFALHRHDHWIGVPPERWPLALGGRQDFELRSIDERSARIEIDYRSAAPTAFVAAITAHEGWQARVDGRPVPTWPTVAGQVGMLLPAGEHRLELRFVERSVVWGAAVTGGTLLGALVWLVWSGRGRRRSVPMSS